MDLARNLKIDSVSRLAAASPLRVAPDQPVQDAIRLMQGQGVSCLLVCAGAQLVGIFTERDLVRRVLAAGKPLTSPMSECMTPNPVVISPKESVAGAIRRMEEGGYRHLPVVDDTGCPVGLLSVKRIVHYLVEHFPSLVYNLPPDPAAVPHEPDGA